MFYLNKIRDKYKFLYIFKITVNTVRYICEELTESVNRLNIDRDLAAAVITNALCMHTRVATLGQMHPSLFPSSLHILRIGFNNNPCCFDPLLLRSLSSRRRRRFPFTLFG